ncbi:hypothetical protein [Dactylosporangium sp. NPDC000521]|uniref:hypothetical protein n=1 Tax=Dactylosporangium sp. NPDC000521 TaxID=3363975 RepID=UPI0036763A0A
MERLLVYAPVHGRGAVQSGDGDVLSIVRSRNVVVGDDNDLRLRYRYEIRHAVVSASACLAIREAYEDWSGDREPAKEVSPDEWVAFQHLLYRRLQAHGVPRERRPDLLDERIPMPQRIEIDDSMGVSVGDGNVIRSTSRAMIVECDLDLLALMLEDHRLVRGVFDSLTAGEPAGVARSVDAAMSRLDAADLPAYTAVGGSLALSTGTPSVAGAGGVMVGTGNTFRSRIECTLGAVRTASDLNVPAPPPRQLAPGTVDLLTAVVHSVTATFLEELTQGPGAGDRLKVRFDDHVDEALGEVATRIGLPPNAFANGAGPIAGWDQQQLDAVRDDLIRTRERALRRLQDACAPPPVPVDSDRLKEPSQLPRRSPQPPRWPAPPDLPGPFTR